MFEHSSANAVINSSYVPQAWEDDRSRTPPPSYKESIQQFVQAYNGHEHDLKNSNGSHSIEVPAHSGPNTVRPDCSQSTATIYETYNSRASLRLGLILIVVGALCITFSSVLHEIWTVANYETCGTWGGTVFILTGVIGISSAISRGKGQVIAFMILSNASISIALTLFGVSIAGAIRSSIHNGRCSYYSSNGHNMQYYCKVAIAMNSLLIILATIAALVTIWSACISCRCVFCSKATNRSAPMRSEMSVYYVQPSNKQGMAHSGSATITNGSASTTAITDPAGVRV